MSNRHIWDHTVFRPLRSANYAPWMLVPFEREKICWAQNGDSRSLIYSIVRLCTPVTPVACSSVSILFKTLGPEPAFGRLGLGGSSGGYSSHGYISHASLRAYGAQLGGDSSSSEDLQNIFDIIYFKQGQWTII